MTLKTVPSIAFEYLKHPTFLWRRKAARSFEDADQTQKDDYQDGLEGVKKVTIDAANAQVPLDGMEELFTDITDAGCLLYLFSNIGEMVLEDLRQKYPQVFQNFQGFHTPSQNNGYAKKPQPAAFQNFMDTHNAQGDTTVFFFDDKQTNVDMANAHGFKAFRHIDAMQTRKHLISFGILPPLE